MTSEDEGFCCEAVREAVTGSRGAVKRRSQPSQPSQLSHKEEENKAMTQGCDSKANTLNTKLRDNK